MSSTPIIPGFHPDPSICRVGNDLYLVTSSFEYLPGVPIFHSTDLVTWTLIGNVLERDDQLTLPDSSGGRGIYAPTIRHHDGRFWMITTDIGTVRDGHLLVSTADPAGPWSPAVHIAGTVGIDPDLFWDEDGTCYLTWCGFADGAAILQAALEPTAGRLLETPRKVWQGTGLAAPEGPHLYRRGEWYYQLLAEGGTERGHAVTVARSRSLHGPWEASPTNPILTHRSTADPVQNTGHADLVELADGSWAMVHLGVRPVGPTPGFHLNGRETFVAGVRWVDDWPVVDEEAHDVPVRGSRVDDRFDGASLDPRWVAPGVRADALVSPVAGGGVSIAPSSSHRALLAMRVEEQAWEARATVEAGARLTLRLDGDHWAAVEFVRGLVSARIVLGGIDHVLASSTSSTGHVVLTLRSEPEQMDMYRPATVADHLRLGFEDDRGSHELAVLDGRYLSTEVAGGFTGRVVGVEPLPGAGAAVLRRFQLGRVENDPPTPDDPDGR